MSKYVFCDLDYTLLNDNREISKENYEAIKAFESKGNHFIICSGRVPFALKPHKDFLNSSEVISSNGALIISDNRILKKELLGKEQIIPIIKYALKNNINVRFFASDLMYILNQEYAPNNIFTYKQHEFVDEKTVYDAISNAEIIKLIFSADKDILEKTKKELEKMDLNIEISYSSNFFLEVNSINQTKGNGIKDYCKLKRINIKDTISIGDNGNDISMLKATNYSACPSNAIDEVKEIVNYVCKNDNNNNAIKEVLEKIY